MTCLDKISGNFLPELCDTGQRHSRAIAQMVKYRDADPGQRCVEGFELNHTKLTDGVHALDTVFVSFGWWTIIYLDVEQWVRLAAGVRRALEGCNPHHPALRKRKRIFLVQTLV